MRRKKSKRQKLKEKIDKKFEHWVRIRDKWTCITCGKHIPDDKRYMQAGHYITRGNESVRWDEVNVNAQCARCNGRESFSGDKSLYEKKHIERYGQEEHIALVLRANKFFSNSMAELEERLIYWTKKLEEVQQIV